LDPNWQGKFFDSDFFLDSYRGLEKVEVEHNRSFIKSPKIGSMSLRRAIGRRARENLLFFPPYVMTTSSRTIP
jgi:hypothetical protein